MTHEAFSEHQPRVVEAWLSGGAAYILKFCDGIGTWRWTDSLSITPPCDVFLAKVFVIWMNPSIPRVSRKGAPQLERVSWCMPAR